MTPSHLIILFTTLVWLAAGAAGAQQHEAADYQLRVAGLACPFCAYGIEKQLRRIEDVERLEVDVAEGRVLLWVENGAALTRERADRAVSDAGFELDNFTAVADGDAPDRQR